MLLRFDPFRELDRVTHQLWNGTPSGLRGVAMDAVRRGDQVVVQFDLPGVDPESIDLTVERNVLTLRAERRDERHEGDEVIVTERRRGTFTRQLFLGETLDAGSVEADYDHGVLTVTIPFAEQAKPRKVAVSGAASDGAIEATSSDN
jgi:HSP20 family protein